MEKGLEDEEVFRGFTEKDEARIYPIVESTSQKLFALVQELERGFLKTTAQQFFTGKEPVKIPRQILDSAAGSSLQVDRILFGPQTRTTKKPIVFVDLEDDEDVEKSTAVSTEVEEASGKAVKVGENAGSGNELVTPDVANSVDYTNLNMMAAFSPAELELLRKPMEQGWSREVVLKSVDGSGAGEVSYISPGGFQVRSYKDLAIQLSKFPLTVLSRQNFSFTARPVGGSKYEFVKLPGESSKWIEQNEELLGNPELVSNIKKGSQNYQSRQSAFQDLKHAEDKKGSSVKGNGPSGSKRIGGIENNMKPEKRSRSDSNHGGYVMGTLPPNHPNSSLTNSADDDKNITEAKPRRRGRPVTKVKEKELAFPLPESDDGMFQISALTKLFAGMEEAELDDYNHMANLMAAQQSMLDQIDPSGSFMDQVDPSDSFMDQMNTLDSMLGDGEVPNRDEILPCSIRCPGMTGDIPTLQCKRCLCLYHAECLGFPPNLNAANFLCSNCEGIPIEDMVDSQSPESSPERPRKESMLDFMEKMMELKKPQGRHSPVTLPKFTNNSFKLPGRPPGFLPIGKGGMSVKRLDGGGRGQPSDGANVNQGRGQGMSISAVNMKRGRGGGRKRGGRLPIPQLSRNLTITPISIPIKGQAPRVPNLAPINGSARNSSPNVPMFNSVRRGRGRGRGTGMVPVSRGDLLGQSAGPPPEEQKTFKPRYPIPNFGASFGPVKPPPPNMFRRFPQSVVTVGQKKFIVVPSAPSWLPQLGRSSVIAKKNSGPFGRNGEVISKVFEFLAAKDLLNASLVSKKWQQEAKKQWRIVRLKNTRIYDLEAFVDFITARNSEIIDFRKMLGSIDWAVLFTLLGKLDTLHSVILGARGLDLLPLIQEHCPNIRVIQN